MTIDCGSGGILVIDSDDEGRAAVSALLADAGYTTREAGTGREGMLGARQKRPDLVLLEVELRDMTGYELCRQLRDAYGEGLPVIFVAATRTGSADRIAGLLIGADDYIVKPFAPDELIARVRRALIRTMSLSRHRNGWRSSYGLTEREREVLRLLSQGLPQKTIARELFISPQTVATHIQRTLAKLDVHSRAEAVALAHRERLVDDVVSLFPAREAAT